MGWQRAKCSRMVAAVLVRRSSRNRFAFLFVLHSTADWPSLFLPFLRARAPQCEDIYHTRSTRHEQIDGAYFGTTFPHLFFLTFPELKPAKSVETYVPRVFGFKIHHTAYKASLDTRKKQTEAAALLAAANGGAGASQSAEAKLLQPQQPPVGDDSKDKLKKR